MLCLHKCSLAFISVLFFHLASTQFNPTILQDSRDLPKVDGTFGFLYRTEDGIAHAAKGDPDGVIHGRFSYTDPTGLKVNFNYNAGSRGTPGYNYNEAPEEAPRPRYQPLPQQEEESPVQYEGPRYVNTQPKYVTRPEPQTDYVPQTRPQPQPEYVPRTRPQQRRTQVYSSRYRDSFENYQPQRRARPPYATNNEIYN